jgi:hypothetical protein
MTRVFPAKIIQILAAMMFCISAAGGQTVALNEPDAVWPSRTGGLYELAEASLLEPDNETGAVELQKRRWQRAAPLPDRILICRPAR